MLKPRYRLGSSKDFNIIYKFGKKIRGRFGMLIVLSPKNNQISTLSANQNKDLSPKFGFVVNKKVGNAVERHKLTRQLRNIVHKIVPESEETFAGFKFSYIAFEKPEIFNDLEKEFLSQLKAVSK